VRSTVTDGVGRYVVVACGPGLATWDFSVLKDLRIHERLSLQFRAEIRNLLNRANFNTPNLIAFTPPTSANPSGVSGTGRRDHQRVDDGPAGAVRM